MPKKAITRQDLNNKVAISVSELVALGLYESRQTLYQDVKMGRCLFPYYKQPNGRIRFYTQPLLEVLARITVNQRRKAR